MSGAKRSKAKAGDTAFDVESIIAKMEAAATAIIRGDASRRRLAEARVQGMMGPPPHARLYIRDFFTAQLALQAKTRGRGLKIIMMGPPHDPMQRPGTEPVYRGSKVQWTGSRPDGAPLPPASSGKPALPQASSGKPAPPPAAPTPEEPEVVLRTRDGDILEVVEDESSPCPRCRGRRYLVDGPGETRPCDLCEGHGCLPVPD